jgi:hypothetical protein
MTGANCRFFILAFVLTMSICPMPMARGASRSSSLIDIRDYGAKCDGSGNDTAGIQSAIDAAVVAGADVLLPAGTCIISPPSVSYIFKIGSNLHIVGQGMGSSVLKVKDGAGDFTVIFGSFGAKYDGLEFREFTIDYNATNNPALSLAQGRLAIGTTSGSRGMTWDRVEIRDISSINVIYSGSQYSQVTNCRFELNTTGTLHHDHSTIYMAAEHAAIVNNMFVGGINAGGAVTAIETHGGKETITGNIIDGYLVGMNLTGVAASDSEGIVVNGNSIVNGYYGITIWSNNYRSHTEGYGITNATISGNVIRLVQTLWTTNAVTGAPVIGNASGITINPTANLPVKTLLITGNTIEYDLESSPTAPFSGPSEMGIGYWDATNSNRAFNVKITGNIVVNAPASAIRWAPGGGDNVEISENMIINAGSAANPGLISSYRPGVMVSPANGISHVAILRNNIIAGESGGMAYGIEVLGDSCVLADGNSVSASGGPKSGYLQYIRTNAGKCSTAFRGIQLAPPLQSSMLPSIGVRPGSEVLDATSGRTWHYNGTSWASTR